MDPITGLVALTGISLASLAGLRLKRGVQEGYAPLPNTKDGYPASVAESQTRYNQFSQMINPLINGVLPVGASSKQVGAQRDIVKRVLGGTEADYNGIDTNVLESSFEHTGIPRADDTKSIFGAMKFCREAGATSQPFSILDKEGRVKKPGAKFGDFAFDEICGVCLSGGVDEEGVAFKGRKGLLLDPSARESAMSDAQNRGLPYPRAIPSVAQCNNAPDEPVFATNQRDLERFEKRLYCLQRKQIDPQHKCGSCYENDKFSYVEDDVETNDITLVLQGVGQAIIKVKSNEVAKITLNSTTPQKVLLPEAKEDDSFAVIVMPDTTSTELASINPTVWGYFQGINPNNGLFIMPLNMLLVVDDITGSSPTKAGGFYTFKDQNLEVAKMRPGKGQTQMALRGIIPFTFVTPDEFSAIDCPIAPYQTKIASISAFATDQPCFAKGAKAGNYNDECLRQRILDAGCTNAGELYKDPKQLNQLDGQPQSLAQIYGRLEQIAANDMIDPDATKKCSGRKLETPCDPYIANPQIQMGGVLRGNSSPAMKDQVKQCVSYLYNNRGANEPGPTPRVGPTYSGLVTYRNNTKERKNIVCIPDGQLNPDNSVDALNTLISIADNGFRGKTSVEAIRMYLNSQLELALDMTKNPDKDPDRRRAIANCFGQNLAVIPSKEPTKPTVFTDPCGVMARYVQVLGGPGGEGFVDVAQLVVIDKTGANVAKGKSTAGSSPSWPQENQSLFAAKFAVDGRMWARENQFYHSIGVGSSQRLFVDLGGDFDITRIIYYGRSDNNLAYRRVGERIQLLDADKNVVRELTLNRSPIQEFVVMADDADTAVCKSTLPPVPPPTIPDGFANGLYVNMYNITDGNPDVNFKWGWGDRLVPPKAYSRIHIGDQYKFTMDKLPQTDRCGLVAKGYYFATEPGTLQFGAKSDDGIHVIFNNQTVLSYWNLHPETWNESAVIDIPEAGKYPIELRFYEWGGEAICAFFFKTQADKDWRTDLTGRFAYSITEATAEDQAYEQARNARLVEEQRKLAQQSADLLSRAELYGGWIQWNSRAIPAQKAAVLPNGEMVFMIYDDGYTKMVPRSGGGRYYRGTMDQFNPANFYNYAFAGNGYNLRIK